MLPSAKCCALAPQGFFSGLAFFPPLLAWSAFGNRPWVLLGLRVVRLLILAHDPGPRSVRLHASIVPRLSPRFVLVSHRVESAGFMAKAMRSPPCPRRPSAGIGKLVDERREYFGPAPDGGLFLAISILVGFFQGSDRSRVEFNGRLPAQRAVPDRSSPWPKAGHNRRAPRRELELRVAMGLSALPAPRGYGRKAGPSGTFLVFPRRQSSE